MTLAQRTGRGPWLLRLTPQMVVLFLIAAGAAAYTVREADGMWSVPGTMGYELPAFMGMWTLMMAAMMLPSVAPFASMYARTVRENRLARLTLFAAGYLVVWAAIGIPAYGLARLAEERAGGDIGTGIAAAVFIACGIYQLTPLKYRCLTHCRTPLGHLLRFSSFKGPIRDLRAGFEHGLFCAACCWGLMVVLVAVGVMNVPAMLVLASVIAMEKVWRWGVHFSRAVGIVAIAVGIAVFWLPGLAPGLTNDPMDTAAIPDGDSMQMDSPGGGSAGTAMDEPASTSTTGTGEMSD